MNFKYERFVTGLKRTSFRKWKITSFHLAGLELKKQTLFLSIKQHLLYCKGFNILYRHTKIVLADVDHRIAFT